MTPAREYTATLVALAAAGATMLAGVGQVWVRAVSGGNGLPTVTAEFTGRELVPAAAGAAILILAGVAGIVATARVARTVVAAVVAIVALGGAVAVVRFGLAAREVGAARAAAELPVADVAVSTTGWWLLAAAGAAVAVLAAAAAAFRGRRWPTLGGRYQRADGSAKASVGRRPQPASLTAAAAWDALDRGEDPTANDLVTEWPDHRDDASPRS